MTLHHLSANDVHELARKSVSANTSLTVMKDRDGSSIRLSCSGPSGSRHHQRVWLSDLLAEETIQGLEFHLRAADAALQAAAQRGRP